MLRELTDTGSAYRSWLFGEALGATTSTNRPHRPRTNGRVEGFNRTVGEERSYARLYLSEAERVAADPEFVRTDDHHRGHTALGGKYQPTVFVTLVVSTASVPRRWPRQESRAAVRSHPGS